MSRKEEVLMYCQKMNKPLTAKEIVNGLYPGKAQPFVNHLLIDLVEEKKLVRNDDERPYTVRPLREGEVIEQVRNYSRKKKPSHNDRSQEGQNKTLQEQGTKRWEQDVSGADQIASPWERNMSGAESCASPWERGVSGAESCASPWERDVSGADQSSATPWERGMPRAEQDTSRWQQDASGSEQSATLWEQGMPGADQSATPWEQGVSEAEQDTARWEQGVSGAEQDTARWRRDVSGAEQYTTPWQQDAPGQTSAETARRGKFNYLDNWEKLEYHLRQLEQCLWLLVRERMGD